MTRAVSSRRRATRRALATIGVALLALAACGGGGGGDDATTTTTGSGQGAAGTPFRPVTIEHRYGSTEVDAAPQRIVSLDPQWTDVLLALGTTPVGYITHTLQEDGNFPWQGDRLAGSEPIVYTDAIPIEAVAALRPDLILVTYAATNQATYDKLAAIAPTIASPTDVEVESWQTLAATTGELLDRPGAATRLVEDVDAKVQAVADELPGLSGKTIAFANYVPGANIVVLSDPDDGANVLFSQLGLELAPGIVAAGRGATGRVEVSFEQIGLLDGDVLAVLPNGADVDDIPGWRNLPAVRTGAVVVLDQASAVALNTPTPLSIDYGLDVLRPALEIAAKT